jgi:uncharacterized protein YbaR (Trm112 family)
MQPKPALESCFRARILIGSSETLSAWIAVCPECKGSFRLLWPSSVLHIPLHRVIDVACPVCRQSLLLIAAFLVLDVDGQELPTGIVQLLA